MIEGTSSEMIESSSSDMIEGTMDPDLAKEISKIANKTISYFAQVFEMESMPSHGWTVNVRDGICDCYFWRKFGYCVHLVAACVQNGLAIPGATLEPARFVSLKSRSVASARANLRASRNRGRGGRPARARRGPLNTQ